MTKITENHIEEAALEWLEELGFEMSAWNSHCARGKRART